LDLGRDMSKSIKSLKRLVPRDRIELPTHGFSVRCSTN
jgi:hypothetical protein